ncbi:helix-turn-helix transcriptional regulator [Cohnella soli]|uniref:Helix-turn-helix domain-containing protein n=1 Tax=Cohnella soli TaxID=425005 RepID=A0ABW0I650_9BACL
MDSHSIFISAPAVIGGFTLEKGEDDPFRFDLHKHDMSGEMLLVEKGAGEFEIGGVVYEATEGTLLFYQRGVWHKEASLKHPFRMTYIGFAGLQLQGLDRDHFFAPGVKPVLQLGEHYPEIRGLMHECTAAMRSGEPEAGMIANHHLGILFAKLARIVHYAPTPDRAAKPVRDAVLHARRYMEENYRNPITLEQLAKETYTNKYHLAHQFTEKLGQSPIQFLIRYRMEVACYYLRETDYPIGQIAERVGYQSEPSFFHVFRRTVGTTPNRYRENKTATWIDS